MHLGFTALAVLSLAVGVGGLVATCSVIKTVLIDPLPYRDSDRVMALQETSRASPPTQEVGGWTANEWRTRVHSFESISLYSDGGRVLTENGHAEVLRGLRVSHDFFETLGVPLLLGRDFQAADDVWPRNNVAILSYGLWMRRFGGDPDIIGRALDLSTEMYRVIGVLPADFFPLRMSNPAERPAIFMPLGYDPSQGAACRSCFGGIAIGRLKPGIGIQQARAELNGIQRELVRAHPSDYARDSSVAIDPLHDHLVESIQTALWVLIVAALVVLLIVCANVANLLLARITGRVSEIAIRTALGCSQWRLTRQFLTESLLLSATGGAAGTLLAWWGIAVLKTLAPKELPRIDELHMDVAILVFAIGISLITGLLFGIAPALGAASGRLTAATHRTGSAQGGLPNLLIVTEVALAFVLATATGLLGKSFLRLTGVDAGFDPHNVFTLTLFVNGQRYGPQQAMLAYYSRVRETIRAVPGVLGVAMADNVPLSHTNPEPLHIEGEPSSSDSETPNADSFWASTDYFRVLKIPLKRGRFFTDQDGISGPPVAIISESLAKSRFDGAQAIGRRIQIGPQQDRGPWFTIIGVVGDVRNTGFDRAPDASVYIPQSLNPDHYTRLLVRTAGDPMKFERSIRAAILQVDPVQAIFHVQSMDVYVASSLAYRSFALTLIGLFGTLAVLLAGLGIYGVISYIVGLRTREVGIRMALGAHRFAILKLILRDVLLLIACGLAAGLLAALMTVRFLEHLLFEVSPTDVATSASVACVLIGVGILAAYFPAHRAATIDPTRALRSD